MRRTGAEIITRSLERQGIQTVVGIPGGANLPLYDALGRSRIRHVLARHEQGAGFIAQGIARATGRAAVCMGTSGPGATNLLTPIADVVMSKAAGGEIWVSDTVHDRVQSDLPERQWLDRGARRLRGVNGRQHLYEVAWDVDESADYRPL